ncbi:glycosyl hydrolase family 18 protein [Alicyclobacillus ferrooxydans]|uniref:glycosyl hydrolase family 18 protein n=1 Tax=Alicyclobacillus ferrooxydans TaxID=471514 RepID=UPI0006D53A83|nr:glycosyl hydrolase family 18 protein [Alicyclobacillus ferrooxydans]
MTDLQSRSSWWRGVIGAAILIAGCIASFSYIFGGGSWNTLSQLEAAQFSTIATTELFGTTSYQNTSPSSSLTSRLSKWRGLTSFEQPLSMLQGQLLPVAYQGTLSTSQQGSLFSSVQQFGQTNQRIVMGWIPYANPVQTIHLIQANAGLNVASPLWLSLKSSDGSVSSKIEPSVVQYAHQHHVQVWALVDNQFNAGLSHQVLSNPNARNNLVSNLVSLATKNHLDGLNIDFENMQSQDQQGFTDFIKSLHQALVGKHIVLSVDITPDIQFLQDSAAYFHAALAGYADYVVLMAYDEHWSTDQTPGPVADLPWVTTSIEDLLDTGVPADKLVLGVPFYARFWHVHQDGSVDSIAVPLSEVDSILKQHQATSSFNQQLGVAYARYSKPDGYEEVWFSTQETLNRELQLVQNDNLAGVSIWSLGLSDPTSWSSVIHGLTQMLS